MDKPKILFSLLVIILFSVLLFSGCIQDQLDFDKIKSQNWESKWAVPLIDSELTLNDIINDSITEIQEDPD
ncbi:MAG: hypothetical protein K8R53_08940 [Bacteroidales bacterium]|nr:hypothetical protein [Bacteroidales bacterium]